MCHFHVVASTLSLPRCRSFTGGLHLNSQQRFWLQLYCFTMCVPLLPFPCVASTLSLPRCRFHVVASTLSHLRCRFHVVASTLSLPRYRFHVVASTLSLPRCRYPGHLETVLNMADMFYLHIYIIAIFSFLLSFDLWVSPGFPCSTTARRQKVQKPASMVLQYYTYWRIIRFNKR